MIRQQHKLLALLIGVFAALAVVYSIVVPPFETPDEIWHFAFIQHVASGQGLPVSEPNTQALWRQQGVQPPAYYLAAAALTTWIDQSDFPELYSRANPFAAIGGASAVDNRNYLIHQPGESWPWRGSIAALHLSRLFSVCLGAVTLWAVYRTLKLLISPGLALLGTALIAFVPQFIFISAAASNDNAINALAALVLWRLVDLLVRPPAIDDTRDLVTRSAVIGVLLGLALLSKLSALGLVALAGLAAVVTARRMRSWRSLVAAGAAIALPALAIGGWWYARNWLLYRDLLAWNMWQANISLRAAPAGLKTIANELGSLETSFWGVFGWFNVLYPSWLYRSFHVVELLVALGLLVGAARWLVGRPRARPDRRWLGASLLLLWLALLAVSWLRFMRIAPAAQGRYFFPAASTVALVMAWALSSLKIKRWASTDNPRGQPFVGWAVVAALLLLSAVTPVWILRPAYLPRVQAAPETALTPVNADVGNGLYRLTGLSVEPTQIRPGDTLTVTVTWQALAPSERDFAVFVHLVNEEGMVLAQTDTIPGGGLRPTGQWQAGQTIVDRYRIDVPRTVYAPDRASVRLGMYDFHTGERLPIRQASAPNQADTAATQPTARRDHVMMGDIAVQPHSGATPNPVRLDFTDNVSLVGYDLDRRVARPGESMVVTLFWQAQGPVAGNYSTYVRLIDPTGVERGNQEGYPPTPTHAWQAGIEVTDWHTLPVVPDAPPGSYFIEVGVRAGPDAVRLPLVGPDGSEHYSPILVGPVAIIPR